MLAIKVDVFRSLAHGDCTNGGISSRFDTLLIEHPRGNVVIDPDNLPDNLVRVVKRHLFGQDIVHLRPVADPDGVGWMAGGNFAYTSDSRFRDVTNLYGAVSIHDRCESAELNRILSI